MLASLGFEVTKIMALARWAGESVLRYMRDAPLEKLPAEVKALEDKRSMLVVLERLQADVQGLDARVEGRQAELTQFIKDSCERFGPVQAKPCIAKGGCPQFKLHVAAVEGAEMLPALWKTKCGVKFAGWAFTRHASPEGFPSDTLCVKWFGP